MENEEYKFDLDVALKEGAELKKQSDMLQKDSVSLHNLIAELQEQLNKERLVNLSKAEKVE